MAVSLETMSEQMAEQYRKDCMVRDREARRLAADFSVPVEKLLSRSRGGGAMEARIMLTRDLFALGMGTMRISRVMGRDHATVTYLLGCRKRGRENHHEKALREYTTEEWFLRLTYKTPLPTRARILAYLRHLEGTSPASERRLAAMGQLEVQSSEQIQAILKESMVRAKKPELVQRLQLQLKLAR